MTVLLLLPFLFPTVITAVAQYVVLAPLGLVGTLPGILVGHTVVCLPYAFVIALGAVRALDPAHERAASSLGAGRTTVLWRVTLPGVRGALAGAGVLCALVSFDEPVVALFLSGTDVRTLPVQTLGALTQGADPTVGVMSTVSILLAVAAGVTTVLRTAAPERTSR
ncbi:hypothetical protein BJF78_19460 [Pseudonocardia sp. CNS-139]|nr:hypothetical protein BJF78_19460 [Pseudonocardia sp. CNS-139]